MNCVIIPQIHGYCPGSLHFWPLSSWAWPLQPEQSHLTGELFGEAGCIFMLEAPSSLCPTLYE
jgi:hypothetical protein